VNSSHPRRRSAFSVFWLAVLSAVIAVMFLGSAAHAAEPAHCGNWASAFGAPGRQSQDLNPFDFIEVEFEPTITSRLCGLDISAHAEYWRWAYESRGCSAQSKIGQLLENLISGPIDQLVNRDVIETIKTKAPDLFEKSCKVWDDYVFWHPATVEEMTDAERREVQRQNELSINEAYEIGRELNERLSALRGGQDG